MRWRADDLPVPTDEAFDDLNVDTLKPLAGLLTKDIPKRKGELLAFLAGALRKPAQVRALYEKLDSLGQRAVQEATHDAEGLLQGDRFTARYGGRRIALTKRLGRRSRGSPRTPAPSS